MPSPIDDMPRGIDVSKFQGEIDWRTVAAAGIKFAFARAVDDLPPGDKPDPTFAANYEGMKAVGILRGAYHFFRPRRDPVEQARMFVSVVGTLGPGDLPPVLDLEDDGSSKARNQPAVGAGVILDGMARWIDFVEDALNRRVMIYTNAEYWVLSAGNSERFRDHPLWIMHWKARRPIIPSSFPDFVIHQYAGKLSVPGVPGTDSDGFVPTDRFNGSVNDLRALAELPPVKGVAPVQRMEPLYVALRTGTAESDAPSLGAAKAGRKTGAAANKGAGRSVKKGAGKTAKKGTKKAPKKGR